MQLQPQLATLLPIFAVVFPTAAFSVLHVQNDHTQYELAPKEWVKVPVVLGVMSRCPDAIKCESVLDEVVKKMDEKIELSLTFIGKINSSEPDFGVTCMHGPEECGGNVQELCAVKYAPNMTTWWEFVQCENAEGRSKIGTPETAFRCAKQAGVDWEGDVGICAGVDGWGKGSEGIELLKESVQLTQRMGIQKSCTIIINNKPVCVHDGGWKDCVGGHEPEDFIKQIEDEYQKLNGAE